MNEKMIILIEKYLDGSLEITEKLEFEQLYNSDEVFKSEVDEQERIKGIMNKMNLKNPSNEFWDAYWLSLYNRFERGLAWLLLSIGAAILFAFAAYEIVTKFIADTSMPLILKYGIGFAAFGALFLIYSLVREKIMVNKRDKYKEIQR